MVCWNVCILFIQFYPCELYEEEHGLLGKEESKKERKKEIVDCGFRSGCGHQFFSNWDFFLLRFHGRVAVFGCN